MGRVYWLAALTAVILLIGTGLSVQGKNRKWGASEEAALRKLIGEESITIELYKPEGGFPLPLQRLYVPAQFVELYKASPIDCLTVLTDIVEKGNRHDALVAFQFGMAGDEPQIALPLFHYLSDEDFDRPFANAETYRQTCLRIVRNQLSDVKEASK